MTNLRILIVPDQEFKALNTSDQRLLLVSDTILDLEPIRRENDPIFSNIPNNILGLYDLCPIDSAYEKNAFLRASETAAKLCRELSGISVNGNSIGTSVTLGLLSYFKQEWMYYSCFEALQERKSSERITVLTQSLTPALEAALIRVTALSFANISEVAELKNGHVQPRYELPTPDDLVAQLPKPGLRKIDLKLDLPPLAFVPDEATNTQNQDECEVPLIVLDTAADNESIQLRHTLRVLNALEDTKTNYRLASLIPKPHQVQDLVKSQGLKHAQAIALGLEPSEAFKTQVPKVREILGRALTTPALELDPKTTLSPHLLYVNGVLFNAFRKAALTYLNIQSLLREPTRSIWVGSYVGSISQALVENAGLIPVFSGPSASTSHHIRNLPFIEPRLQMLAYGTSMDEIYRVRGLDPKGRIHHVGPLFYEVEKATSKKRALESKTILLMTARMNPTAENQWLIPLLEWVVAQKHTFKIRQHPNRPGDYKKILSEQTKIGRKVIYSENEDAETCIDSADIVISDVSTSAIISAAHRQPLVQVETEGEPFQYNDLSTFGVSVKTRNAADTISTVEQIVKNLEKDSMPWNQGLTNADYGAFDKTYCFRGTSSPAQSVVGHLLDPAPTPNSMEHGTTILLRNIEDNLPA